MVCVESLRSFAVFVCQQYITGSVTLRCSCSVGTLVRWLLKNYIFRSLFVKKYANRHSTIFRYSLLFLIPKLSKSNNNGLSSGSRFIMLHSYDVPIHISGRSSCSIGMGLFKSFELKTNGPWTIRNLMSTWQVVGQNHLLGVGPSVSGFDNLKTKNIMKYTFREAEGRFDHLGPKI